MKNIIEQFLDELEIDYTRRYVDALYNGHPHKNNMYGLKMMLGMYGIRSLGVKIPDKDLSALTFPCILHLNGDFVIAMECTDCLITYRHKGVIKTSDHDELKRLWTGNALVVEEETAASEPDYHQHKRDEILENIRKFSLPVLILISAVIGIAIHFNEMGIYWLANLFLNLTGFALSVLLMQKQIFGVSRYGDTVCSLFSHSDCNNVLDSPASKFMGMSWSEIGIGYFAANILVSSFLPDVVGIVAAINWIAMLYGIWSIYYQWRKARSWCTLCVAVQAVVWLSGIIYVLNWERLPLNVNFPDIMMTLVAYSGCIIVAHLFAMAYSREDENLRNLQQYRAMKANSVVAKALLEKGDYYETTPSDSSIIFGPRDADIRITILSNPHCNPCARMHKQVESLLALDNGNICIQYVFSSFSRELEDSSRYLISCYLRNDEAEARHLFDRWYAVDKSKYTEIIGKEQSDIHTEEVEKEMDRHRIWRNKVRFSSTPTVIVNGHILPEEYDLMDMAMIVDL